MPVHNFWGCDDYPILINPEFHELQKITQHKWDTLRICVDGTNIGIASGYGNTHSTVTQAMQIVLRTKRMLPETYILFREDNDFWFNLEDVSGERKAHYKRVLREYFSDEHSEILQDIINERS